MEMNLSEESKSLQNTIRRICDLAEGRYRSDVDRLTLWANTNSGTENHEGNATMLSYVQEAFNHLPGTGSILEVPDPEQQRSKGFPKYYQHRCRPEAPIQVLLNGHADTVFDQNHIFQTCQVLQDDCLQGPGVTDMKGGLVILIAALDIFESIASDPNIGWEVIITCDEEIGSQNSLPVLEASAKRNHLGITFESSLLDGKLVRKRMGVGTYTTEVFGKSAHVGRNFQEGRSAIVKLSEWIQKIHSINGKLPGVIVNAGVVSGGGPLNVVSEYARAQFNIRVEDAVSAVKLFEEFDRIKESCEQEGYRIEAHGKLNRMAKEAGPGFDKLFEAWQQVASFLNMELSWRDTGGGSDGNILQSMGLPIIDNLGAIGDQIHSDGEFIRLKSLTERTSLVAGFLWMLSEGCFDRENESFGSLIRKLQDNN